MSALISLEPRVTSCLPPGAVAPLETGAPDFSLAPEIRRAILDRMRSLGEGEYPPREGLPALREAIAHLHRTRFGIPDRVENIQITYGGMQALTDVLGAVLEPGDEVLLPAPFWYHFPRLIAQAGGALETIATDARTGFKMTADQLADRITPKTRALILTNPNNPTGSVYDLAEMNALAEVLARFPHVLIIADEVYNQLVFGVNGLPATTPSLAAWPELRDRVLTVNSFSKNFGLSGLRVGYVSARPEWVGRCTERQRFSTLGVNAALQEQALAVLSLAPAIVSDLRLRLLRRRAYAGRLLHGLGDLAVHFPNAGYYFFVDARAYSGSLTPSGERLDDDVALARWLADHAGVTVQTGSACGAPGFLRLTFAVPEKVFALGAARLGAALSRLRRAG